MLLAVLKLFRFINKNFSMQTQPQTATRARLFKVLCLFACLFLGFGVVHAQDNVYAGPGAKLGFFQDTVVVFGKMKIDGGSVYFNPNTRVLFYGDTMQIVPGSTVTGTGHFIFKGPRTVPSAASVTQYLNGGGVQLSTIVIDNPKNLQLAATDGGAKDTLRFVNGKMLLNGNTFAVGSGNPGVIDGYNENRYVVTNGNLSSGGFLTRDNVGAVLQTFPIGPHTSLYTPGAINNTGTADLFRMRVASDVREFLNSGTFQNNRSTQTTWFVEERTAGGSNADLYLQHDTSTEGAIFRGYRLNHFISRYVGFQPNTEGDTVSETNWDNFQKTSTQAGVGPGYLTTGTGIGTALVSQRAGLTYFGPFAKTSWVSPYLLHVLPVEFLGISAVWKSDNVARVSWNVANDNLAAAYQVERALPGASAFTTIATVPGKKQIGIANYAYNDDLTGVNGTILYRITSIGTNGTLGQSGIAKLFRMGKSSISMAPNPATDFVDIRTFGSIALEEALKVTVYTNTGALVMQANDPTGTSIRINTSSWSEGVYMVHIEHGGEARTEKLIVHHD
jgi:hypothetical protein